MFYIYKLLLVYWFYCVDSATKAWNFRVIWDFKAQVNRLTAPQSSQRGQRCRNVAKSTCKAWHIWWRPSQTQWPGVRPSDPEICPGNGFTTSFHLAFRSELWSYSLVYEPFPNSSVFLGDTSHVKIFYDVWWRGETMAFMRATKSCQIGSSSALYTWQPLTQPPLSEKNLTGYKFWHVDYYESILLFDTYRLRHKYIKYMLTGFQIDYFDKLRPVYTLTK